MTEACPRCGDVDVHHSRPRSPIERFRCRLTGRVPFRCYGCKWRGWRREAAPVMADGPRPVQRDLTEAELERLDPDAQREERA